MKTTAKQLGYDSNEELYFDWWVDELIEIGLVEKRIYHPKTFELSEPLKEPNGKMIIGGCSYTCDFLLKLNTKHKKIWKIFYPTFFGIPKINLKYPIYYQSICTKKEDEAQSFSWIEIKPEIRNEKGHIVDPHNIIAMNAIKRKWVLQFDGVFVQMIKPVELFRNTFYPINYLALKRKTTGFKTIKVFFN